MFYGVACIIFQSEDTFLLQWPLYLCPTVRHQSTSPSDSCQINHSQSPEPFSTHPSQICSCPCAPDLDTMITVYLVSHAKTKPPVIPQFLLLLNTHMFMKYCHPVAAIALNSTFSLSSKTAPLSLGY